MKLVLLSDLHEHLPDLSKLDYDGVIIAGDLSFRPYMDLQGEVDFYLGRFYPWVKSLEKDVFCIYGNHDHAGELTDIGRLHNCNNLTIAKYGKYYQFGLDINAHSFTLPFCDWGFQMDERRMLESLKNLGKCDLLVTHGPPYSIGDKHGKDNLGSKSLLRYIEDYSIPIVVNGHVHSGRGIYKYNNSIIINCSFVDEQYKPVNRIFVLDTDTGIIIDYNI